MLFTIPLRRAMVTTSDLPYPEGVAAAEVLRFEISWNEFAVALNQPIKAPAQVPEAIAKEIVAKATGA